MLTRFTETEIESALASRAKTGHDGWLFLHARKKRRYHDGYSGGDSRETHVNVFVQKALGVFTGWTGDGPWRSKSVLAALAVVVVGLGFWCSDIKSKPSHNDTNNAAAHAPGVTASQPDGAPTGPHWNWSKPFPFYVRMGASYVAGFCLGWLFRRVLRLILVVSALAIALLAYGKLAGCDMTRPQEQIKHGSEWAQHEASAKMDYLKHLLPSATTGGIGVFWGFRRRSKATVSEPATDQELRC
jgi:hypothetical protein